MQRLDLDKAWCIEAAVSIAENILMRGRCHAGELYWDPGFSTKGGQERTALECSYGFGTPGILLFLARLNSVVPDERYTRSVRAASDRVIRLLKTQAPHRGMYIGAPGALSAILETQNMIGEDLVDRFSIEKILARISTGDDSESCAVSNGHAGTILALERVAQYTHSFQIDRVIQESIRNLLSAVRLEREGLVCGRNFDAVRMPVGFYSGSAGIRYALAPYESSGVAWVREGLEKYENAAYERAGGRWKDFVNEDFFGNASNAVKINRALLRGDVEFFGQHAYALGWGAGSAGIMATHSGEVAKEVTSEMLRCLRSWRPMDAPMDVFGGVTGICSCALHCASRAQNPDLLSIFQEGLRLARKQFAETCRFRTCDWHYSAPLGLLHGESGIGMFLLDLYTHPQESFLFPARPSELPKANATAAEIQAKVRHRHFPLTEQLGQTFGQDPGHSAMDFAPDHMSDQDPFKAEVFRYEYSRLRTDLDGPPRIMRSCRQAYIEDFKTNLLGDASDHDMRRWKVRLAPGCNLGMLNFGWSADPHQTPNRNEHTLILLYPDVDGIEEIVLSAQEYQLLGAMKQAIRISTLVRRACKQWPFNELLAADAESQILAFLRKALSAGYIEFV